MKTAFFQIFTSIYGKKLSIRSPNKHENWIPRPQISQDWYLNLLKSKPNKSYENARIRLL